MVRIFARAASIAFASFPPGNALAASQTTDPIKAVQSKAAAVAAPAPTLSSGYPCARMTRPLGAGAFIAAADLAAVKCAQPAKPAFAYDQATHFAFAARALAAGELVPLVPSSMLAGLRPGDPVVLLASIGPVTIERQVKALQPCQPGGKVFVRGERGTAFAVDCPEPRP